MKYVAVCRLFLPFAGCALLSAAPVPSDPIDEGMRRLPPVKRVSVRGAEFAYVDQGKGEPVILLHGFLHDYRIWFAQLPELAKRYRVIAYSQRYRLPNPWPAGTPDFSAASHEADLVALIQKLKLGRVHLVGHSGGANIAAMLARDHPELVRSVVLAEPFFPTMLTETPEGRSLTMPAFIEAGFTAFAQDDFENGVRILARGVTGNSLADGVAPAIFKMGVDNARFARLELHADYSEPEFHCADAAAIKAPALLIEGEATLPVFHGVAEAFRKCVPALQRAVLPKTTHALEIESPAAFNDAVLSFLDAISRRHD